MCASDSDYRSSIGATSGAHSFYEEAPISPIFQPNKVRADISDAALLRLAQSLVELSPELARQLCRDGLNLLDTDQEKALWAQRLQPFLQDDDEGLTGPSLSS